MKKVDIRDIPLSDLLRQYRELAIELGRIKDTPYIELHEQAALIKQYNKVFLILRPVKQEVAARRAERALLPFLEDPNPWVQKNAASQLLPIETEKARAVLKQLGATGRPYHDDVGFRARWALGAWDEGTYTPIEPNRKPDENPEET